ncbi:hypothetical protein LI328DRAFT_169142 [Trichoderma asperelloides]|nr:hypothetical protein LI328DRAFT_169142 [Trichoderma asperelloides]
MTFKDLEKSLFCCSSVDRGLDPQPRRTGQGQNLAFFSRAPFLVLHRAASSVTGWRRSEECLVTSDTLYGDGREQWSRINHSGGQPVSGCNERITVRLALLWFHRDAAERIPVTLALASLRHGERSFHTPCERLKASRAKPSQPSQPRNHVKMTDRQEEMLHAAVILAPASVCSPIKAALLCLFSGQRGRATVSAGTETCLKSAHALRAPRPSYKYMLTQCHSPPNALRRCSMRAL